jgi:hypothetical protein
MSKVRPTQGAQNVKKKRTEGTVRRQKTKTPATPERILTIDIGGTKIKLLATGQTEARKLSSGSKMTPARMVRAVEQLTDDWRFDAISIGYPGLVGAQGPRSEPGNLGRGWVGFDFAAAFGKRVRMLNDAAMQALGGYEGGRMLFLGLGTGLGSALIAEYVIVTLELGQLPYHQGETLFDVLTRDGLERLGKKAWRKAVAEVTQALMSAFIADYVLIGGGLAKELKRPPAGVHLGNNMNAFRGGYRLWHLEDVCTLSAEGNAACPPQPTASEWRVL